ncbi:hypothetical protein [Micrococcus sp.]|uniref:hypothetical protein n=1 Tax=Micrococcus sp. TaxID=1271 RepID=UPI002A91E68B|nr:hypothetical protein [Micrococcus sp.]MDY6054849.1 hypothetical protein [Micrococcus sp.]
MAFDWGEDPLGERDIVSVHKAVPLFNEAAAAPGGNGMTRVLTQMRLLSESHSLGFAYVSPTEAGTRYHRREVVEGLARQPVHTKDALVRRLRGAVPSSSAVLVLRQRERTPIREGHRQVFGPRGEVLYERNWYGYDRRMDRSADPDERRQQDDASREVWSVSAANARLVDDAEAQGGFLPLVISVGGLIVSCREILGFDRDREEAGRLLPQRSFRVRPAGDWAEPILDTWLDSGAGKAALWWSLR